MLFLGPLGVDAAGCDRPRPPPLPPQPRRQPPRCPRLRRRLPPAPGNPSPLSCVRSRPREVLAKVSDGRPRDRGRGAGRARRASGGGRRCCSRRACTSCTRSCGTSSARPAAIRARPTATPSTSSSSRGRCTSTSSPTCRSGTSTCPANGLIRLWNVYYGIAHFLVTLIALVWMFRRDPLRHRLLRNTLVLTTALAVIGFAAYSLMPPRLLDDPGRYGGCQVYAPEAAAAAEPGALVGAGLRQVRLRRHDRRLRRLDQLRQRGLRGRLEPVRRDAEHAHRLGHVDGHRARAVAAPPLDARARHRLPGAHAGVHRPHRQPLLDRRRRRAGLPGGGLRPGPADHAVRRRRRARRRRRSSR